MKLAEQVRRIVTMSQQSEEERTKKFFEEEYDSFLEEVKREVYRQIVEAAQHQFQTIHFNFSPYSSDFIKIQNDYHVSVLNQHEICNKLQRDVWQYLEDEGFHIEMDAFEDPYDIRVSWLEE